ncbi:hypothetical protein PGT21_008661 [Puccinia graminis f. sp. tritici]|uniref:Uncharacterized protein n=1 Tax=Puccinia graminis f. sp. tritici TaxID=56615 RepID=A0A5B0ME48_PUCGR|nr:hypothetical protein PGT21_008661 [Puccinia graminis f. sp. tritici]
MNVAPSKTRTGHKLSVASRKVKSEGLSYPFEYKKLGGANATAPAHPLTHSPHQPNLQPRTGRLRRGTSELNIAE